MASPVQDWFASTQALLTAVTALLAGIVGLLQSVKPILMSRKEPDKSQPVAVQPHHARWPMVVGLILVSGAAGIMIGRYSLHRRSPLNEQLTSAAWGAYSAKDWNRAIARTTDCIGQFGPMADTMQKNLEAQHTPPPPVGVVSEPEKTKLLSLGPLNDVGACWFIKARAEETLGHKEQAMAAYQALAALSYARIYDPAGFFWSPADAGSARLRALQDGTRK